MFIKKIYYKLNVFFILYWNIFRYRNRYIDELLDRY